MSETAKHTPKPWRVEDRTEIGGGYSIISETAHYSSAGVAHYVSHRDAHLIAAAPTMLEAAELAMEGIEVIDLLIASIEKHGNYSVESTLGFLNQARCARLRLTDAIALAKTGATP